MNPVTIVLVETKRILNEVGWTKDATARDAKGQGITALEISNGAIPTCFCLIGAMGQACSNLNTQLRTYDTAYKVVMDNIVVNDEVCCYNTLSYFNDDEATTLEMINDTLDRAISKVT